MNPAHPFRVLATSFQCKKGGASEGYSAYKWIEQIARFSELTLATVDETPVPEGVELVRPSTRLACGSSWMRRLNGEMKFDYYRFDRAVRSRFLPQLDRFDLVHHVAPIAPRYPCSIAGAAKHFILGPIGGCQRVPEAFRAEVEKHEDFYFKLRVLDRLRLRFDPWLRSAYQSADKLILVGKYMLRVIPEEFHSKSVFMLETGIESGEFRYQERPVGGDPGILELLYVGRVVPYKGLIYVLRALAALGPAERIRFRLRIVGDRGEAGYEALCKEFVLREGLSGVVEFLGFKSKDAIVDYYERADLFVFPSLAETSGNVLMEAMAVGCPALVARCGGPGEIVTEESGFLLDAHGPGQFVEDIREAFRGILRNPEILAGKRHHSRRRIVDVFDWSQKGRLMRGWYEEVVRSPLPSKGKIGAERGNQAERAGVLEAG